MTPAHITAETRWPHILSALASGNTLLFAPGLSLVWVVDTVTYRERAIDRPQTEISVRGPEEAFNEVILTQMNQVRQRLHDPSLRFHQEVLGQRQQTAVVVAYLADVANPALVDTCITRVQRVEITGHVTATQIAGLIRDHPRSIFPTLRSTERVDLVCWGLLAGKVAILVDGDPFVLLAPAPLADFYRTAMDYSGSWYDTAFVRLIRVLGWSLGVFFPAFYIALTQVNPNFIPAALLVITLGSHAALPFSPFVEVVLMVGIIEILREAALRLPKSMGATLGTVGAIVVGTAVVKAGFVSPQIIVVITITALSFYAVPVYELTGTWRLVNLAMLVAAVTLGFFGMVLLAVLMIGILTRMQSFGTPYFVPYAPLRVSDWKDALIRLPWTAWRTHLTTARASQVSWRTPRPEPEPPHLQHSQ